MLVVDVERHRGGHINDSWLVTTERRRYLAQRLNTSVFDDLPALDHNARAVVGGKQQVLDTLTSRLQDAQSQLDTQHASQIEADPVKAYSDLSRASAGLEAALNVSPHTMQKSLLDYP